MLVKCSTNAEAQQHQTIYMPLTRAHMHFILTHDHLAKDLTRDRILFFQLSQIFG